jgi:PAS domain S-box-containing protein
LEEHFFPVIEMMKQGEFTQCGQNALEQSGIVIFKDVSASCPDCPLVSTYNDSVAMTVRIEHDSRIYGILSVSTPAKMADDAFEQAMFKEVAGDIGFALHDIELEEARKQAEKALKLLNEELEMKVKERTAHLSVEITERTKAEQHIEHLNSVLRAIRNVNQLIVKEKDRDRLLQKVCDILVDARGYDSVWFGLLEDGDIISKVTSSSFGKDVSLFEEQMMGGDHPSCIRNALARKEMVLLVNKSDECGDCSLKDAYADKEAAIIRIEHEGRLFGLLAVSFSPDVDVDEKEKDLLREVASDISFALHNMEKEEARKKSEMETRLLQKLTMAISEASDFEKALNTALSLTCEHTGWVMGEAWIPNHDKTSLEYCLGYYDDSSEHNERLKCFIELSKQFTFPQGVGLPGRVWQLMQLEWQNDVASLSEEIYLRAKPSKDAGLKAALGVPIISNGQVLTVLVFYTTTPHPEDERQIKLVSAVAAQLGTVILRKQAEKALEESEKQLQTLIDSMPDFVCFKDGDGRWLKANDASIRIFQLEGIDYRGKNDSELAELNSKLEASFLTCKESDARAWKDRSLIHGEESVSDPDGSVRVFDVAKVPIFYPSGERKGIIVLGHDITERKKAEKQIKKDLKEKEVFLQEIHHRVKNNMQIISSLLKLQSAHIKDKRALELFQNSRDRVKTMSLIHDALYRSKDLANIDFADYVRKLTTQIFISYGANSNLIKIKINIKDVLLNINMAIPCGLIINELVSNSLKYAFPKGKGEISISFTYKDKVNTLRVKDNGIGILKEIDLENSSTLGLLLVNSLTKQLDGTLKLEKVKGTSFKITFKKTELKTYGKV